MITWPDNLVDAIARRKCVLFLDHAYLPIHVMRKGNIQQLGKTFYGEF